jgi:hypothetical protein
LFNTGIVYTIGNYHAKKYGQNHFLRLLGLSCLAGGAIALATSYSNENFVASGSFDISGGLIGYNLFRNPAWFAWGVHPLGLLTLFTLYTAFYGDRAGFAGLSAGYLAFLLAL